MDSPPQRDRQALFPLKVSNFLYSWPPNDKFFLPLPAKFC